MTLSLDHCGESTRVDPPGPFVIGRDADYAVDDNPFLHRSFLSLEASDGLWLLTNVGDRLAATVSDTDGRLEAYLAPAAVLPLVFERTIVRFTAGPTAYELAIVQEQPIFHPRPAGFATSADGTTTIGRVTLTPDQRLLILALAEPALQSAGGSASELPSSPQAARRLGWTTTKFNRKLDNVCDKLARMGVRGLHGQSGNAASNRRARLVEYALAVRLVTRDDLPALPAPSALTHGGT